ncbi:unknown protein [Parachlamydia acanthamoebae UV-7]|uniref:Uncharacterized protein n=1 Tax=Parachlamydia acanthamoebae (strain UV7) TaxID=765952 RepID=F8L0Y5_PARAV|nr:unknown protein [Parachlamydia acanthamoebae UV-7]
MEILSFQSDLMKGGNSSYASQNDHV